MATEGELRELDPLSGGAKEYVEFGLTYILLPALRLPNGNQSFRICWFVCLISLRFYSVYEKHM